MKRFKDILCVAEPEGICEPALEHTVTLYITPVMLKE